MMTPPRQLEALSNRTTSCKQDKVQTLAVNPSRQKQSLPNEKLRPFHAGQKVAGHRNDCCDGLLFPPEQGVKCTHAEGISSGIFRDFVESPRRFAVN
jgi:hypothetical protein